MLSNTTWIWTILTGTVNSVKNIAPESQLQEDNKNLLEIIEKCLRLILTQSRAAYFG